MPPPEGEVDETVGDVEREEVSGLDKHKNLGLLCTRVLGLSL